MRRRVLWWLRILWVLLAAEGAEGIAVVECWDHWALEPGTGSMMADDENQISMSMMAESTMMA